MPGFELQQRPSRPVLVIPLHSTVSGIPAALGVALPEVWHAAEALGMAPDGPPFTRYLSEPSGEVDYEAGVMLSSPAPEGRGRAMPAELPAGPCAVAWHVGPYETLGETYDALMTWIAGEGRAVAGPMWEVYWTDPGAEPDPSRWRTEIIVPVA